MKFALALAAFLLMAAPAHAAAPPAAGEAAPAFTLPDQDGKDISLENFKGKWVVLYFYPKDATPGCSLEAQNFQRDLPRYAAAGAYVVGVSVDDVASHKKFCDDQKLQFTLLSDAGGVVSESYGSTMQIGLKKVAARNTFLIDPSGTVRKNWLRVEPVGHSDEVLAEVEKLAKK